MGFIDGKREGFGVYHYAEGERYEGESVDGKREGAIELVHGKEDERGYEIVSDMISFLGIKEVDLMTNNPKKIKALEAMGVVINQRVPIYSSTNKYNEKYISTKVKKLGHLI